MWLSHVSGGFASFKTSNVLYEADTETEAGGPPASVNERKQGRSYGPFHARLVDKNCLNSRFSSILQHAFLPFIS